MPSLITHYIFADEAIKDMNNHLSSIVKGHPKEFNIGSSGPDFFFYYNALPWTNQKKGRIVANYGSLVHAQRINDFFKEVFIEARDNPNHHMISHIAGLLCHWSMDKVCHPYIFYSTNGSTKSSYYHRQFESHLDTLVLNLKYQKDTTTFKGYELLVYDDQTIKAIYNCYFNPLLKVYNITIDSKLIARALNHFYTAQKLMYDPNGKKKKTFETIEEKVSFIPPFISSMIVPKDLSDPYDILNNLHRTWRHPVTNEASNQSFMELYDVALHEANTVLNLFNDYLLKKKNIDDLLDCINNQSFETGLSTNEKMIYSDCVYE